MFSGFAKVWTPLIETKRVGTKPQPVVLAGERIVLFRDREGAIGALLDRCPHRGAALSVGTVTTEGRIACPFHGWEFDRAGVNCHVPLNPDAKRTALSATALPVRVLGDLVWVYTAPLGAEAPPEPVAPEGLVADGLTRTYVHRMWNCHWSRAMENMLDSPHLPFVHRRTIGRVYRARLHAQSRMDVSWEPRPWGGVARASLDGDANGAFLEFFRPNVMALHIPMPGRHLRIHALVIPESACRTHLIVAQSRDFARLPLLNPIFALMNGRIADEDKAVVESAGCDPVPPAGAERSVETDRATLQFRKYYFDELSASEA
jgi:phenylpropionate dioxygenase-like ring-hydroxylating dioxygenase large terminal subunit